MADLKFGDRKYRKMGDTWMVQPATLMRGFIAVSEESTIAMLDEVERLRAERDDHKARLAVEAVTAPDADFDTMMDSLQARLCDLHAEVERLRAEVKSLTTEITHLWIPSAEKWMEEANRLRAAGDALAEVSLGARPWITPLFAMEHGDRISAATAAWREARRG